MTRLVRVRYAETDQMGVVYHANYLIWFEVGRVELIRALGIEYKRMELRRLHIVVADAHCRYHLSAMYDEIRAFDAHRGIAEPPVNFPTKSFATQTESAGGRRDDARDLREQRPAENCCPEIPHCVQFHRRAATDRSDA